MISLADASQVALLAASLLLCSCGASVSSPSEGSDGPKCVPGMMSLEGLMDGRIMSSSYDWRSASESTESLHFEFGARGEMYLFGDDMLRENVEIAAAGLLRMPSEGPSPDAWFYDGAVSVITRSKFRYRFSMPSLVRLGTCPGAPIVGEISYDSGSGLLSGSLDELPIGDRSGLSSFMYGAHAHVANIYFDSGGVLYVDADGSEVVSGYLLVLGEGLGHPATVYCIGGGSYTRGGDAPFPLDGEYVMTDLSRLGVPAEMAAVASSLEGCYHVPDI